MDVKSRFTTDPEQPPQPYKSGQIDLPEEGPGRKKDRMLEILQEMTGLPLRDNNKGSYTCAVPKDKKHVDGFRILLEAGACEAQQTADTGGGGTIVVSKNRIDPAKMEETHGGFRAAQQKQKDMGMDDIAKATGLKLENDNGRIICGDYNARDFHDRAERSPAIEKLMKMREQGKIDWSFTDLPGGGKGIEIKPAGGMKQAPAAKPPAQRAP